MKQEKFEETSDGLIEAKRRWRDTLSRDDAPDKSWELDDADISVSAANFKRESAPMPRKSADEINGGIHPCARVSWLRRFVSFMR